MEEGPLDLRWFGEFLSSAGIPPGVLRGVVRAMDMDGAGDSQEAVRRLRALVRRWPGEPAVHVGLAMVLHARGKPDEAAAAYGEAERLLPGIPEVGLHRASTLLDADRPEEALQALDRFLRLRPEAPAGHLLRATAFVRLGRDADAEADFRRALAVGAKEAEVLLPLGMLLSVSGRASEGIVCLERLADLRPSDPHAWSTLGLARAEGGEHEGAIEAFRKARELDPGDAQNLARLGLSLRECGRDREAVGVLRSALTRDPGCLDAHHGLSQAMFQAEDMEGALPHARAVAEGKPDQPPAQFILGTILVRLERWEEAVEVFRRGLALEPGDAGALEQLGRALSQLGRLEEARAALEESDRCDPDRANVHAMLSLLASLRGDEPDRRLHERRLRALDPGLAAVFISQLEAVRRKAPRKGTGGRARRPRGEDAPPRGGDSGRAEGGL